MDKKQYLYKELGPGIVVLAYSTQQFIMNNERTLFAEIKRSSVNNYYVHFFNANKYHFNYICLRTFKACVEYLKDKFNGR